MLAGLGWMFDTMDIGLFSFVLVAISQEWGLSQTQFTWATVIGLAGMSVGASASGMLSDRYGRKAILLATLLVYSVATGLTALAWGFGELLVLRFVTGLGLGGELPVASTLVAEIAPSKQRRRMLVLLESFWAYGWIWAAAIGFLVVPELGWRVAFLFGALPAFYVLVLRRHLPESPRYLTRKGRHAEAREAAEQFGVRTDGIEETNVAEDSSSGRLLGLGTLWGAPFARGGQRCWGCCGSRWSFRTTGSLRGCRRYWLPPTATISGAPSGPFCL